MLGHAFQHVRAFGFQCRFVSSEVEQKYGWLRAHHCLLTLSVLNRTRARAGAPLRLCARTHLVAMRTNLVDPASSHMLVSKIKPCMSQYKLLYRETANGSLKQL